jgi:hypothetical protein
LRAYNSVIDLATGSVPVAEAWIRELHAQVCASQETYGVVTEIGPQQQALPKGRYRTHPNHVRTEAGIIHSYAPVDLTPSEMHRLVTSLNTPGFLALHPAVQAAYVHYALVAIHPFADGNGRVARALASVYTCRHARVPLLILADQRADYLLTLSQPFVSFLFERALDALNLVDAALESAGSAHADVTKEKIRELFQTRSGLSQVEIDQAALNLRHALHAELDRKLKALEIPGQLSTGLTAALAGGEPLRAGYRALSSGNVPEVQLHLSTAAPAAAVMALRGAVQVPIDCDSDDDLFMQFFELSQHYAEFTARANELYPKPTVAFQMRVAVFVEGLVNRLLESLQKRAAESLRNGK